MLLPRPSASASPMRTAAPLPMEMEMRDAVVEDDGCVGMDPLERWKCPRWRGDGAAVR